jgi:hypothetical protein
MKYLPRRVVACTLVFTYTVALLIIFFMISRVQQNILYIDIGWGK